jgi:hypothetical protein
MASLQDFKLTIYKITSRDYIFIGTTENYDHEKANIIENVEQYKMGRLQNVSILYQRISLHDYEWTMEMCSEIICNSQKDVDVEIQRICDKIKTDTNIDAETMTTQTINRENEIALLADPIGFQSAVELLPELPKMFVLRKQYKFYNFQGIKVFWSGRYMCCHHLVPKKQKCLHCWNDKNTDKKYYLRCVNYFQQIDEQRKFCP